MSSQDSQRQGHTPRTGQNTTWVISTSIHFSTPMSWFYHIHERWQTCHLSSVARLYFCLFYRHFCAKRTLMVCVDFNLISSFLWIESDYSSLFQVWVIKSFSVLRYVDNRSYLQYFFSNNDKAVIFMPLLPIKWATFYLETTRISCLQSVGRIVSKPEVDVAMVQMAAIPSKWLLLQAIHRVLHTVELGSLRRRFVSWASTAPLRACGDSVLSGFEGLDHVESRPRASRLRQDIWSIWAWRCYIGMTVLTSA